MLRSEAFGTTVALGAVAGLRSLTAPALVSLAALSGVLRIKKTPLHFLASPAAAAILTALAVGELVADKLPSMGARIEPGPLAARVISGAGCGAAVCLAEKEPALLGAVAGALASVGAAYAGYSIRKNAVDLAGVPALLAALAEDCIAIGAGAAALSTLD